MSKTLWYAVNGSGQGCIFISYPERDEHRKIWVGDMMSSYTMVVCQMESEEQITLPALKWSDDPVKLELEIKVT